MTMIQTLLIGLGRRLSLAAALLGVVLLALWVAVRRGRNAAKAEFAVRSAEARIRSLTTAKEVRHEIEVLPEAERDRRLDRWMRD
jgi:hypothetical protein